MEVNIFGRTDLVVSCQWNA